ncbi:hypothetical protein [Pelomicrobium sp. G1]|jgi:hypothetical protein|uniref:hypothetical protein n=1 Tax=unclassified Pelomicrobium TaxID=2815318 RepID=UPI00349303BA
MSKTSAARGYHDCPLSEKLLYSAFLVVAGIGYLLAMTYLYLSHAGHDGKPGLSIEDIVFNYYGNRSGTRLEAAIRGPMAGYMRPEERHHVVAWLKSGATEKGFKENVWPILQKNCIACHSPRSGLKVPDLSSFDGVRQVAAVDTGESLGTLVKLSHIHLFGISLLLLGVGMIFRRASLPDWLRGTLMLLPFAAMLADIGSWFLAKWDPVYAYTVVIGGALLGLALAAQILISLFQIWFLGSPPEREERAEASGRFLGNERKAV